MFRMLLLNLSSYSTLVLTIQLESIQISTNGNTYLKYARKRDTLYFSIWPIKDSLRDLQKLMPLQFALLLKMDTTSLLLNLLPKTLVYMEKELVLSLFLEKTPKKLLDSKVNLRS
eukprot:gnl/Spiro4/29807_TR14648_c0_g1_i1.p2 gnl/Spiro4/29807_TR14648_c0_g1~~gnl/Spiro4/29807_TR14648_c0_g1_i1.p2  ORF type:complete len:115 (+),score=6.03 gnl/Spiro4/29807_TR14648_c0_g1_i1:230-574(+)